MRFAAEWTAERRNVVGLLGNWWASVLGHNLLGSAIEIGRGLVMFVPPLAHNLCRVWRRNTKTTLQAVGGNAPNLFVLRRENVLIVPRLVGE